MQPAGLHLSSAIKTRQVRVLSKEEELGCFEILKNNFPDLKQHGLVIGLNEFLSSDVNLQNFICYEKTAKEKALEYINAQKPYIVLDESEGYKCIFFRGNFIKAQYDATNFKMLRYIEDSE